MCAYYVAQEFFDRYLCNILDTTPDIDLYDSVFVHIPNVWSMTYIRSMV